MYFATITLSVLSLCLQKSVQHVHFEVVSTTDGSPDILLNINRRLSKIELEITQIAGILKTLKEQSELLQQSLGHNSNKKDYSVISENCKDVQNKGNSTSGIYLIRPEFSTEPFPVYCDMDTRGGGWTYFLNRYDGSQTFDLNWWDYRQGFGNIAGEFWLGLDHLYQLTGHAFNELLIELEDWDHKTVYAHYDNFNIGGDSEDYILKVLGTYTGTAGDSFRNQAGAKFTTRDKDNDFYHENCADYNTGGWWFNKCTWCHLTGKYLKGPVGSSDSAKIMYWLDFRGNRYSLKKAKMMVRPKV